MTAAQDDAAVAAYDREKMLRTRRMLIGVLATLIILLLLAFFFLLRLFEPVGKVASVEEAKGIEWIRSIYGWGNDKDQQLGPPQSVAVAPDGTIWVTDAGMARIVGFNPDASYRGVLDRGRKGSSRDALGFPTSIAVDESGVAYIGDMTSSRIVVMTPDKQLVRVIPAPRPRSVAVRGDHLVVGSNPGFAILSKTGEVQKVIGTFGKGDTQFNGVSGVAIAKDGTIFALDQYNNRVSAYTPDGERKWIRSLGAAGNQMSPGKTMRSQSTTAQAAMQLPSGITIDGAGRLVIVDAFGFNIVVLNAANGDLIGKYGDAGTEDGKFVYPGGISYDAQNDYFAVADTAMNRVQLVRLPGSGGTALASLNRSLAGPLRACLVPLLLLLLAIAATIIYRMIRRRREADDEEQVVQPA